MGGPKTSRKIVFQGKTRRTPPKPPIHQKSQNTRRGLSRYPLVFWWQCAVLKPYFCIFSLGIKRWGSIIHSPTASNGVQLCSCRYIYIYLQTVSCPPFALWIVNCLSTWQVFTCPLLFHITKNRGFGGGKNGVMWKCPKYCFGHSLICLKVLVLNISSLDICWKWRAVLKVLMTFGDFWVGVSKKTKRKGCFCSGGCIHVCLVDWWEWARHKFV